MLKTFWLRRNFALGAFSWLLILAGLALGPGHLLHAVYLTSREAATVRLSPGADGSWASEGFRLLPAMGPVGLILKAEGRFSPNLPGDQPPRDRYRAVLHQGDRAGSPIPLELEVHPTADTTPHFRERLVLLARPQAGVYRLELLPETPPGIALDRVELEVRSQVQQVDNRLVAAGILALGLGALLLLM